MDKYDITFMVMNGAAEIVMKTKSTTGRCLVCDSKNAVELYPSDINLKKLSFTYEFSPESQKTFRVVRCADCTHVFCAPIPKNIYKNYEDVIDKEYLRHVKTRELSAKAVLTGIGKYAQGKKLLDVGCATGDFLKIAKDFGYVGEGLELSHWSSDIARKRGIKVYRETLKSLAKKAPQKYDVITLWGVIEHFERPAEEIEYLHKLLKPNGIIILWTGNVDGLMSRLLGRRWWYWQGQHIQYFTNKSLNFLGEAAGFEILTTKIYPIAATYEQMRNSLTRYRFHKYVLPFIKVVFMMKPIWYLRLPGEMLWVAQKRKGPKYSFKNNHRQ
jgi:SAM-dependent methyltransferase